MERVISMENKISHLFACETPNQHVQLRYIILVCYISSIDSIVEAFGGKLMSKNHSKLKTYPYSYPI